MRWLFVIFAFVTLAVSCENNERPDLYGKWNMGNDQTITFYKDSTFLEEFVVRMPPEPNKEALIRIRGTYDLVDSICDREQIEIVSIDDNFPSFSLEAFDFKFQIDGNRIQSRRVDIFNSFSGQSDSLFADWRVTRVVIHKYDTVLYAGRDEYTYKFHNDNRTLFYGWTHLDNPVLEGYSADSSEYSYSHPYLTMYGLAEFDVMVSFRNGQMRFDYNDELNKQIEVDQQPHITSDIHVRTHAKTCGRRKLSLLK